MPRKAELALAALAALAVVGAACSGGEGDKAGGKEEGTPLVLALESEDDLTLSGAPEFAEAVERLSGGSMRIEFLQAGRGTEVDFERGVVEDVRDGRAQLGIVGVRVWDMMGVTSFQALLAPFLVDSLALERAVVEGALGERMLRGIEEAGVVGVAVHPGPLRQPFGLTRRLTGPEDFRGAKIGMRPGYVAQTTFRALGGAAHGFVPGSLSGLDGVETDAKSIDYNGWDQQGGSLTTNVVLWPKPYSIFMNREAFEAIEPEQREILIDAGRAALVPELRQTERDADTALAEVCRHGRLYVVEASSDERRALREAVQPVYDELERDSLTRKLISEINDLREGFTRASALPRCVRSGSGAASGGTALEGRWRLTWTRKELIDVGIPAAIIPKDAPRSGTLIAEFEHGRYRGMVDGRVMTKGTYTVEGDVLNLVYEAPTLPGYVAGQVYRHRWNVFRDRLTFSRVSGSDADRVLLVKPLTRVG